MGAGYYDPLLGRFITQDPSRDGLNWYAYGGNNPVNAVDPTGLSSLLTSHRQYEKMQKILAYEAKNGSVAAISRFNNTMSVFSSSDDRLGNEFDDQYTESASGEKDHGVMTTHGYLDLDWWAEMLYWTGESEWPTSSYYIGKGVWHYVLRRGGGYFADPKERVSVDAINAGAVQFSDLFTPEFMKKWGENLNKADAAFAKAKQRDRSLTQDRWQFVWPQEISSRK